MPNESGKAYGLTTLCPIKNGQHENQSFASSTREILENLPLAENSPMAKIPNTYLSRLLILNDPTYEGAPHELDQLKSKYLVFTSNFHGDLEAYLEDMWGNAQEDIKHIWQHCVGFDEVNDVKSFITYIKKCQVETTFYFNGSNDDSLVEQLKALYLKQEFSKFVYANQGKSKEELFAAFKLFDQESQPSVVEGPTWRAGEQDLDNIIVSSN
ncbi:MAG: hypothetical protein OCD76_22150 [Reichenbachiella sp.]